ncbi:MAG: exosortase/archaeosortase family protein [Verrucomicrobiota bacterium]
MSELATTPALTGSASAEKMDWWRVALLGTAFLFLWLEVVKQLGAEWSLNVQYSYGWAVPFLALFLLWQRWSLRPEPSLPSARAVAIALIAFCTLLFLPIRLVAEANPDWRLLSWALALSAVAISILLIYLRGGASWARHFAFPFFFFLVAVPWPVHFEEIVIQDLMHAVTAINVTALNIIDVPALQHGNVIEVSTGLIGIEEACSGVRSLQATLMVSLFLGELYSFSIGRRLFLIFAGAVLAFITNVIRTAILVWIGAHKGVHGIEGWHDPAGLTILLVCLFGLWFVSLRLRQRSKTDTNSVHIQHRHIVPNVSSWILASIAIWLLFAEAGVQIWYGVHPSPISSRWVVSWPTTESEYKNVPIAPEAEALLHYNEGGGARWSATNGHQWMMYFFRWLPGQTAARFVKIHRPDICLPASGITMIRDNGIRVIAVNGVNLPLRSYLFDDRGTPLHVFYCYWDARSSYENAAAAQEEDWTPRGRVRSALRGRREVGAQMLEIVVWGYENDVEAESSVHQQLEQIVRSS